MVTTSSVTSEETDLNGDVTTTTATTTVTTNSDCTETTVVTMSVVKVTAAGDTIGPLDYVASSETMVIDDCSVD